ncbi:hypothetical protein KIN20_028244, partial [Parelaphostrongylus tenuis]
GTKSHNPDRMYSNVCSKETKRNGSPFRQAGKSRKQMNVTGSFGEIHSIGLEWDIQDQFVPHEHLLDLRSRTPILSRALSKPVDNCSA